MTIFGIGTQIVDCARVASLIEKHGERFLMRVYSHAEIEHGMAVRDRNEYFAAVWAGKQAIFRALGQPWRQNTPWQDLEIRIPVDGEPTVTAHGGTLNTLMGKSNATVMLTTSHCRVYATATAIIIVD